MSDIPASHITDAQKLEADGVVELFELIPQAGGTLHFKNGNDVDWQSNTYTGLPCSISDIKRSSDQVSMQPRLTLGEEDIDLSMFKPLLHDGYVDGATLIYKRVLLTDILANNNIVDSIYFRVKRVESYSRSRISLGLSSASEAMNFTLPNLQYYPPAFPAVAI